MADVFVFIAAERSRDMRRFTGWAAWNDLQMPQTTAELLFSRGEGGEGRRNIFSVSRWAAEPPTPALDQSMLLHLQAMSGPARSAAHWRSTEEHIMLPTAAPSLFILLFFSFLCSYFFSPASAFYIKSHQRRFDEHGRSVSGLSVSLRGSLTVTRTLCPLLHLFGFYFCSPAFLKTHKLTLATCCILLLLFFLSICPFFLPILKLFAFIPLWKRCQGY